MMTHCKNTLLAKPTRALLTAAVMLVAGNPVHATSAVADAAGRVLAYYYSMEELASYCQAVLPSAAPGLGVSFAGWQARNESAVERVQERFAVELADDLNQPVVSPDVQRELRDNLRATRNATAEFQRDAIRKSGDARAREACVELDLALGTHAADIDLRNPDDWATLFSRAPANPVDVIGHWATRATSCVGEVWTLHADGREQLSVLDADNAYGYVGNWSLADGLYRSQGTDDRGAEVKQLGTIETDPGGTVLIVTISQQTQTVDGQRQTLVTPEQAVTVQYQRCDDAAQPAHYDFAADEGATEESQDAEQQPPAGADTAEAADQPERDRPAARRRGPRR